MTPCIWAVVPAAGVGRRMQADRPKQYLLLGGKTVLEQTVERLLGAKIFTAVAVAVAADDPYWPELPVSAHPQVIAAPGGEERADSVLSALKQLEGRARHDDWVLVHDAARPCITAADIQVLIASLGDDPVGGILALPVHDTLKGVTSGRIDETIDRSRIWRALTPQMFRYAALTAALEGAAAAGLRVTDEASAMEWSGQPPAVVEGRPDNIKITRPEDLALAAFFLEQQCYE